MYWTGQVCNKWAYLEYLLSNVIWWMLKLDKPTGMIVTGGLDMLPRLNMAINLGRHLKVDRKLITVLIELRGALQNDLIDRRNLIVHGVRSSWDGDDEVHAEVHRGKGARVPQRLDVDHLISVSLELGALQKKLIDVIDPFGVNQH